MTIHFGHRVGKYDPPSTELPRGFCAWIGPLQLGVVLVYAIFQTYLSKNTLGIMWENMALQK